MAIWSTIAASQLEYSRIDADFYQPRYLTELELWKKLNAKVGVSKLKRLISAPVRTGRTPKLRAVKEGEPVARFIKTDTVRQGFVNFDKSRFLPLRVLNENDYIPVDGVVVTIIGATPEIVGRAAIVRAEDPVCVTNQNVAVIGTNENCDPYFLTAYLQTAIGRDQLWRHSRRTEQVNLNCREVERILVPTPPIELQRTIGQLVRKSFKEADSSITDFKLALDLVEKELRLDKLEFEKPMAYKNRFSAVRLSNAFDSGRIDAQCFAPTALFFDDRLRAHGGCVSLSHLLVGTAKGHQHDDADEGSTDYCSIKHINGREIVAASRCFSNMATVFADQNDLLLAVTGATIGKVGIVKRYSRLAFSGDLLRLRVNERVDPHYLLAVLNHDIGQVQFNRWITGSTNGHLAPRDVRRVLVPRLKTPIEKQIAELVEESLWKKTESERLLEEAKARVEQLIEEAVKS
jgi:restriction endonuclease S subunit